MAFSEKGIKYFKKSKTRENNPKMEKKLPEKWFLHILKKALFWVRLSHPKRSKIGAACRYLSSLVLQNIGVH